MVSQRNVILITYDSLRADHCSFMGYERETTPSIDKMAKDGLFFKNAIAASLPTPVSMFSTFTSEYYLGFNNEQLAMGLKKQFNRNKTIAEVLSEKGYHAMAINSNPYIPSWKGFGKGFDFFEGYSENITTTYKIFLNIFKKMKLNPNLIDLLLGIGISCDWEKNYELIAESLRSVTEPYFLWVLLLDTHVPYFPPKRRYSNVFNNYSINYKLRKNKWIGPLEVNDRQNLINAYDDSILYADGFVNRLQEDTEKDDPIFIIHADHGDGFEEHGFYHHPPKLYEELIHIPLVIYNSDIKGEIEEPVSLLGLSPSILDAIGENNEFRHGSFLSSGEDYVISKVFDKGKRNIAIRTKKWKFIEGQKDGGELFNLNKDLSEKVNLVNDHPDLVKEFRNLIRHHTRHEEKIRIMSKF